MYSSPALFRRVQSENLPYSLLQVHSITEPPSIVTNLWFKPTNSFDSKLQQGISNAKN